MTANNFSEESWATTMRFLVGKIDEAVPRKANEVAWRLTMVARHRTTMIRKDETSFMTWVDLAKIFGWRDGPSLSAHCRRKFDIAIKNSGMPCVNVLAPLRETFS